MTEVFGCKRSITSIFLYQRDTRSCEHHTRSASRASTSPIHTSKSPFAITPHYLPILTIHPQPPTILRIFRNHPPWPTPSSQASAQFATSTPQNTPVRAVLYAPALYLVLDVIRSGHLAREFGTQQSLNPRPNSKHRLESTTTITSSPL